VIERGAVLEGVINWDGVKTGRGSRLAGSILGRHVVVHHEAVIHKDVVIGDRSDVAPHTLVPAGARLEPRSSVSAEDFCDDPEGG
jgi:NDP-sugar pyrophosphorylase family protein